MNELLQIQKGLGSSRGNPWPRHMDDEGLEDDEPRHVAKDWLILPVNYNLYHKGYTTKHWLSVFRVLEDSS